jgi:hypothetical protein
MGPIERVSLCLRTPTPIGFGFINPIGSIAGVRTQRIALAVGFI